MINFRISASGPIFDGRYRRYLRQAGTATVKELVDLGRRRIRGEIGPGRAYLTGAFKSSIKGTTRPTYFGHVASYRVGKVGAYRKKLERKYGFFERNRREVAMRAREVARKHFSWATRRINGL